MIQVGAAMATTIRKMAAEMEIEIEHLKELVKNGEAEEEEMIRKARAENNKTSWSRYGEWRGGHMQAKREDVKQIEKKMEDLKKLLQDEERKEAE